MASEGLPGVRRAGGLRVTPEDLHLGRAVPVSGLVPMDGARRHPDDTEGTVVLTLYGQDGELQTMPVRRSRTMELFQEWLRRYDRYTPRERVDA